MELLEKKIISEGKVFDGDVLKVDSFLNHKLDIAFINELGKEFARLFEKEKFNKIFTIESSGIGIASITAMHFDPMPDVVFAKKAASMNIGRNIYSTKVFSYTKGKIYDAVVSKDYLNENDRILIIDDFLANGSALQAMVDLCRQAGATIVGAGVAIEKTYQDGGTIVRNMGIRVETLAKIKSMSTDSNGNSKIEFC